MQWLAGFTQNHQLGTWLGVFVLSCPNKKKGRTKAAFR
jgi:hypothetical protein